MVGARMNKEILEITKKFHDTYEKLASEYTYETREDTKVFDINSNNGKLMYATVNEIVSPILEENKKLNGTIQTYDILLKANVEENKRLKDNWNKLKEWVNKYYDYYTNEKDYIGGRLCFIDMKNKMQEIGEVSDEKK